MYKTQEHNIEFAGSKRIKFRGIARIPLSSILFSDTSIIHAYDKNDTRQLKNTFLSDGYFRYDQKNYISALVHTDRLDEALGNAKLNKEALVKNPDDGIYPMLRFPIGYTLYGLQGQDRIFAGQELLLENDKWWTVRLYVQEEHSNAKGIPDGEKFRMIRICQIHNRPKEEENWWAGLTLTMQDDFRQFIKHAGFMREVDHLIQIPGLWSSVKMGALRRLFTIKCDEESIHYLGHVNAIWHRIASHLGKDVWAIDDATVEYLQLRAPGISSSDRKAVSIAMESGQLFPLLVDPCRRTRLLASILDIQVLIPSIQTFFENLIYLDSCAKVMRGILNSRSRLTVKQSFQAAFNGPTDYFVEEAEGVFRIEHSGSDDALMHSYKQLWLYSMRHFPEMVGIAPKKEGGQPSPRVKEPNSWLWYNFAAMAKRLGFETAKSREILSTNPDVTIARKLLLEARPQDCYYFDDGQLDLYITQISKMLATTKRRTQSNNHQRAITSKNIETLSHRSGRPYEDSQTVDKNLLFLPTISNQRPLIECQEVTSYFVKRDFFASFFDINLEDQYPADSQNTGVIFSENTDDNVTPTTQQSQRLGDRTKLKRGCGSLREIERKRLIPISERRHKIVEKVIRKQHASQLLERKKRRRKPNPKEELL